MTEITGSSTTDTYSAFLQDLSEQNLTILGDDQIRERIKITRDPNATDEEKSTARNDVIESSLRLIPFAIKKFSHIGILPEELIGQGFEIVDKSIDKWDSEYISPKTEEQVKFSTYLTRCLETGFRGQRTVARVDDFIPTPEHVEGISNIMRKARELFFQEEHREPSQDEWYKRSVRLAGENHGFKMLRSVTPDTFEATKNAKLTGRARFGKGTSRGNVHTDSLSPAIGTVENTLIDETENTELTSIGNITKEAIEEELTQGLDSLTNRERTVLELRFAIGLNEEGEPKEPLTLGETGAIFGLTRERIRQIESKALRKLRHPTRSKDLQKLFLYEPDEGDRKTIERQGQEADYKELLRGLSDVVLKKYERPTLVRILAQIRNGNHETGHIDLEQVFPFSSTREQLELLKEHERNFGTSPRIFVNDFLQFINNNIVSLREGGVYKDYPNASWYWSNQFPIDLEEVAEKSKELRKKAS